MDLFVVPIGRIVERYYTNVADETQIKPVYINHITLPTRLMTLLKPVFVGLEFCPLMVRFNRLEPYMCM